MGIDRWVGITCDGCAAGSEILEDVRSARDAAKMAGWAVALRGGIDLCPACARRAKGGRVPTRREFPNLPTSA